jgi:hypothetical protein
VPREGDLAAFQSASMIVPDGTIVERLPGGVLRYTRRPDPEQHTVCYDSFGPTLGQRCHLGCPGWGPMQARLGAELRVRTAWERLLDDD